MAALVSLTTMTRMVQEKRIEIGTFKALGYSRAAIVSHYLIYSLSASTIGSLIGISIGFRLLPPFIMNAYGSLYAIPDSVRSFNTSLALQASLMAILFTATAAVAATLDELREVPASLMRPKSPKSGKKIFLERIGFIWKRLSFTKKVTARNVFRYNGCINLTMKGEELKLDDDGVILTKKLSKLINKKVGDTIEITLNDKVVEAKISAVTEHYIQHYIYMSQAYYQKIFNAIFFKMG